LRTEEPFPSSVWAGRRQRVDPVQHRTFKGYRLTNQDIDLVRNYIVYIVDTPSHTVLYRSYDLHFREPSLMIL